MISLLVEAKRSSAWEARLDRSSLEFEVDRGARRALWVFDSIYGPDGYALREMMLELAKREGLTLYSFGPRYESSSPPLGATGRALFRSRKSAAERVARRIREAVADCGATVLVVGSTKGTFAKSLPEGELWEVQHGLLDASYFPLDADRFFTRSKTSHSLIERTSPATRVAILSEDLAPPTTTPGDLVTACAVACYSKNPGGGCTAGELAEFERAAAALARQLSLPFLLKPHPRDSRLKLIWRHRQYSFARHLRTAEVPAGARLVLSSFSTALTSETRKGDLLLNVALSPPNPVIAAEYAWLPNVPVSALADPARLPVVERQ